MKTRLRQIARQFHVAWIKVKTLNSKPLHVKGCVLIIAPHPDDEVIGCGGLIGRLVAEGRPPHVVILTGGEGSHRGCCNTSEEEIKTARRTLTRHALSILGMPGENIHELDFPDGAIGVHVEDERRRLKELIDVIKPDAVFVPHWGEGWNDHVIVKSLITPLVSEESSIWEYCVWMWYYNVWRGLDWRNAAKLQLSPTEHQLKLAAIDAYIKPLASCGRPWSGVLPQPFIKANQSSTELYFKGK